MAPAHDSPVDDPAAPIAVSPDAVIARFVLAGYDCLIVSVDGHGPPPAEVAGTLSLSGRKYGILALPLPSTLSDPIERLSPRELEIATLIANGCCDKEVGRRLGISCHTVGAHIARCFAELDLHKRTELATCIARRMHLSPRAERGR